MISIRDYFEADVAILQVRDLFDVDKFKTLCQQLPVTDPKERTEATLEQILWKGDLALVRPITGEKLKDRRDNTFEFVFQPDGTFHQEDSHRTLAPIRSDDGSFAGLVDQRYLNRE